MEIPSQLPPVTASRTLQTAEPDGQPVPNETPVERGQQVGREEAQAQQRQQEQRDAQRINQEMAARDREVRRHEQTHAAIGGRYASAPSYTYERGPDGQLYAVEGQVRIDTSKVADDPYATLEKAEIIIRAALAVAEPSPQDRRVAAQARAMAAQARSEIAQAERAEAEPSNHRGEPSEADDHAADQADADQQRTRQREQREQADQASAQSLAAFNQRLHDIHTTLQQVNQRLVEVGVFEKLFPEGSVIDKNV